MFRPERAGAIADDLQPGNSVLLVSVPGPVFHSSSNFSVSI
jgi:hypothetical protein